MAFGQPRIEYKTNAQILTMREAGLVLAEALDEAVAAAQIGVTTAHLDAVFAAVLERHGATSNFLGYHGFPATICASVNEEVVHGFPSEYVLKDGDVLKIDGGAIVDGWHADSARTVIVGTADPEDQRLSDITEEAMWRGIAALAEASFVGADRRCHRRLRLRRCRASRWASWRTTWATASDPKCTRPRTCSTTAPATAAPK